MKITININEVSNGFLLTDENGEPIAVAKTTDEVRKVAGKYIKDSLENVSTLDAAERVQVFPGAKGDDKPNKSVL